MPPSESKPNAPKDSDIIVVDLGTKKSKAIKLLRKGKGSLMDKVKACIEELKVSGSLSGSATPVVIVVKEESAMSPMNFMGFMKK